MPNSPSSFRRSSKQVVQALSHGQSISILTRDQEISTQQAAEILGLSRPTVVKLIDSGELTAHVPGAVRRKLRLADVLAIARSFALAATSSSPRALRSTTTMRTRLPNCWPRRAARRNGPATGAQALTGSPPGASRGLAQNPNNASSLQNTRPTKESFDVDERSQL